jgi:RNA exonuclease 1
MHLLCAVFFRRSKTRRRLWTAQQLQDLQRQEQQQKQKAAAQQQAMQQQAKDSGATTHHKQQQQPDAGSNLDDDDADAKEAAEEVAKAEQLLQQQYGEQQLHSKLAALDRHVGSIYAALPPNALLIVATGHGDMPELRRQQELKYKREQRLDGMRPWSTADEEAFCRTMEEQMRALCFCAVKR